MAVNEAEEEEEIVSGLGPACRRQVLGFEFRAFKVLTQIKKTPAQMSRRFYCSILSLSNLIHPVVNVFDPSFADIVKRF